MNGKCCKDEGVKWKNGKDEGCEMEISFELKNQKSGRFEESGQ